MKKIVILLSVIASMSANAQDLADFHILATDGDNSVKGKQIKPGLALTKSDSIFVGENSYVGVLHKSGYCFELKEKGGYAVHDLHTKTNHAHTGVGSKYSNFALEHFTQTAKKPGVDKIEPVKEDAQIKVLLPKKSDFILVEVADIFWIKNQSVTNYKIQLKDKAGKELYTTTTATDVHSFNPQQMGVKKEMEVKVVLSSSTKADVVSDEHFINVISGEKAKAYEEVLKGMQKELHTETAIGKILLASYCEHHKLYVQAINFYKDAIDLAPGVEEYETLFQQFKHRVGITY